MACRVTIRLDDASQALLEAEAARCGVALGALIRESAVRAARDLGRAVSAGDVKLRARSVRLPVAVADRKSSGVEERAPVVQAAVGNVAVAGNAILAPVPADPGVERVLAFRRIAARRGR